MLRLHKKLLRQMVFFGFVGVVTLLIDVAVTSLLYNKLHFPAYLASATGFLSGFSINFPMNRKRVFRHSDKDRFSLRAQMSMFAGLSMFNLVVTSALIELFVSHIDVKISYAKLAVMALIAVWNFLILKNFIFSKTQKDPKEIDERTFADIL